MLIVQPEAEADIAEARAWYQSQRAGVGDELIDEIDRVFSLILRHPEGYAIVHRKTRKVSLRRFPYSVLNIVRDTDVYIIGVIHQRRDPALMKARTQ